MTMRESCWFEALGSGFPAVLGDPTVLEVDSEGESRTSLGAPPPLLETPPPLCVAVGKAAAEEARCEAGLGAIVLERADSSWLPGSCCPGCEGEKGDEVDDAADDLRLLTRRVEDGSDGKFEVAGDKAGREPLGDGVLRWSWATVVEMGVRRVLCCWCLEEPQGCCVLIRIAFP